MHKLRFLLYSLLGNSCRFLQPWWTASEWGQIAGYFAGRNLAQAAATLEQCVCRLAHSKYALGLNLGRSAIQVALEAFDFPRGSEVILPSFSCAGVIMPVLQAGLEPVLADVDRDFNLSAPGVAAALGPKTRAVVLAHLSGKFARDTGEILSLAKSRHLRVIKDACQAFGLQKDGKWAGTFGDVGIFSFGLGKNLFGPGGGMLITGDDAVISSARRRALPPEDPWGVRLRVAKFAIRYGFPPAAVWGRGVAKLKELCRPSQEATLQSFAYPVRRLSDIDAALALCQVERHQEIIRRRQANARALLASGALEGTGLDLPDPGDHIFTKFLLSTTGNHQAALSLQELLQSRGIETEPSYVPLHLRPAFARFRRRALPETERRWSGAFSLPVHPRLGPKEMDRIISVLQRFTGKRR